MNRPIISAALLFFSLTAMASQAKISTLDNELEEVNTVDVSLAQKKTERRGAWEGDVSVGKTTTVATDDSPTTVTLDLTESIDYNSLKDWTLGVDGKQDHENDGLNVVETGVSAQKKIYYTRPKKKMKSKNDDDETEPFYPSLAIKMRLASGSTSEGTGLTKTKKGTALPKLIGFRENNESLIFACDFLESWSAGFTFIQYQYIGFDKTQAFLYAHPGVAQRLSGATSSVSSVVDREEMANIQWFFSDTWDVNLTETLQTDYVTGDLGTTTQLDFTWAFLDSWSATFTVNYETITPSPGDPTAGIEPVPAQYVWGGGLAVAYTW